MAGAYQLTVSRGRVVEHGADGEPTGRTWQGTVTVRDGRAKVKASGRVVADAATAGPPERQGGFSSITMEDGTTWTVTKTCGCGR